MYEWGRNIFRHTYKRAYTATDTSTSNMEEFIENCKSGFEDIWDRLVVFKESEIYAENSERRTADFEDAENITINSVSLLPKEKKMW